MIRSRSESQLQSAWGAGTRHYSTGTVLATNYSTVCARGIPLSARTHKMVRCTKDSVSPFTLIFPPRFRPSLALRSGLHARPSGQSPSARHHTLPRARAAQLNFLHLTLRSPCHIFLGGMNPRPNPSASHAPLQPDLPPPERRAAKDLDRVDVLLSAFAGRMLARHATLGGTARTIKSRLLYPGCARS